MISRSLSTPGAVNPTSYERVTGTFAPNVAEKPSQDTAIHEQLILLSRSFLAILKLRWNRNRSLEDESSIQRNHFQLFVCVFLLTPRSSRQAPYQTSSGCQKMSICLGRTNPKFPMIAWIGNPISPINHMLKKVYKSAK